MGVNIMITKRIWITGLVIAGFITGFIIAGCDNVLLHAPPSAPAHVVDDPSPDPDPDPGPEIIVRVTGLSVNNSQLSLAPGGTHQLITTIAPRHASNPATAWSSSNPGIATISPTGIVTAVSTGMAIITVITVDGGKTASCQVQVKNMAGVSGLSAIPGNGAIVLSWVNPTAADFESVVIDSSPAISGLPLTLNAPADTHTITGLTNGTAYTISIKSKYTDGNETGISSINVRPAQRVTFTDLTNLTGRPWYEADDTTTPRCITHPETGLPDVSDIPDIERIERYYQVNISDRWGLHTGQFMIRDYQAVLTLFASPGYNFFGFTDASFRYTDAESIAVEISPDYTVAKVAIRFPSLPKIELSGKVTDGVGAPLAGVPVSVAGVYTANRSTRSDGTFYVDNLWFGTGSRTIVAYIIGG